MKDRLHIVMYGANGNALSMAQELLLGEAPDIACEIVAFIDDFAGGPNARRWDRPLVTFDMWRRDFPDVPCLLTMGSPQARRTLRDRIDAAGGRFAVVHDPSLVSPTGGVVMGKGCYLGRFVGFGHGVSVGKHVHLCPLCAIGSHVSIGDFCSLFPSVTIADHVIIGESVFVGAGAVICGGSAANPLVIGAGARIWTGAVVTRSVAPGATVAGNPAGLLRDVAQERRAAGATRRRKTAIETAR